MSSGVSRCCGITVPRFKSKRFLHLGQNDTKTAREDTRRYTSSKRLQLRTYQNKISKSLMPFHLPGLLGSNDVLSAHVPYRAGAAGLSIWSGLPPRNPRGTTPWTSGRCNKGGGVGIARTGSWGPIGARKLCAKPLVTSAARIEMVNVFIIFSFPARRASSCP